MAHITIEVGDFKVKLPFEMLTRIAQAQSRKPITRVEYNGPSDVLFQRLEDIEWSVRTANCFKVDGLIYIGDLIQMSERYLLAIPNFGRRSLSEVKDVLTSMQLSLNMRVPTWTALKNELAVSTAAVDTRPVQYYNGGYDPDNIKPCQPHHRMERTA